MQPRSDRVSAKPTDGEVDRKVLNDRDGFRSSSVLLMWAFAQSAALDMLSSAYKRATCLGNAFCKDTCGLLLFRN